MLPQELKDRYFLLKLVQQGIGGEIFLVEHRALHCRRIIKTVYKSHPQYGNLVREAKLIQQIRHPSIPIIYDVLEYDTAFYLIEEYVEGETLRQFFLRQRSIPESLLLDFSMQLCEILRYIHSPAHQILHLDLKPDNLLITDCTIKLIDFGSAICLNQEEPVGVVFGSIDFCAPEQRTAGTLSEQTDLYALGRLFEYMLLYTPKSPREFLFIVNNCLRKGKKLYASAEEVKKDIEAISYGRQKTVQYPMGIWYAVTGLPTAYHSRIFATALAAYLKKRRKRVLFLSCNESCTRTREETLKNGFVYEQNGITVVERIAPQEMKGWRGRGYDCIVCDFGANTFEDTGIPFRLWLCVGSMSEWTVSIWHHMLDGLLQIQRTAVIVSEGDASLAAQEFGTVCTIGRAAFHTSVFQCSGESEKLFKNLL